MKKSSILALQALLGLQLGLLFSSADNGDKMTPEMDMFYQQLDPEEKREFQDLDAEHKKKAMSIVEHYCQSIQECKGHREKSVREQYLDQMQQRAKSNANDVVK